MLLFLFHSRASPPISFAHFNLHALAGDGTERKERDSSAVQIPGPVLPRGRGRGADPGRHQEALLPAGEGAHPVR